MTAKKKTSTKNSPVGIDEILRARIKEGPPVLINGILPAGGGMILGGESEVGKSLMRVEWSVLLACGLPIYGMRTPHAQTVLVFQTENTIKQEQFRTRKIMQGYGIESCHNRIFYARSYRKPSLLNDKFLDHAEDQIKGCGATVVWYDPLVSFHNKNENDNVAMRNVLDAVTYLNRKTGAASIIIHHFGQPGKQGEEIPLRYRLRGASSIRDWADTIITLRHTSKADNPGPGRQLDYIKIRNGPQRAPLFLERDQNFVHQVAEDNRKASPATVARIVSENQNEQGYQGSQNDLIKLLKEATECSTGTAHSAIKEAIKDGYIKEKLVDGVKYFGC
jgi:RecA-family ATPase